MKQERRRSPRSKAVLKGVQHFGNRRVPRTVTNISSGGFFIENPGWQACLGEQVVMEFPMEGRPLRVTGQVVYLHQRGVGVQITRADWQQLSSLLSRAS